jgi:GGDEF domain-containing protein
MKHSLSGDHNGADTWTWCGGLQPQRVVIELTEHGFSSAYGIEMLLETARAYRAKGFEVAIDDLGEGSSKLRLWPELRPDFVKIDRYFVQGIDKDLVKTQFVRSIHEIANNAGTKVIAEGIETRAELLAMEHIGIGIGQGYFIGHPLPDPTAVVAAEVIDALRGQRRPTPAQQRADPRSPIERDLLVHVVPASPETTNEDVFLRFEADPTLLALPVVDADGYPLGLINRYHLIGCFARPYYHEVYGRKSCQSQMDEHPLRIDKNQTIQELGSLLGNAASHHVVNGFLITEQGRYLGVGTTQDLVRVITEMQINAARHANPLTQLPGNVPINETIEQWLHDELQFAVCYIDLDHFKPFNDVYGFAKGDDIIKLTGRILSETTEGQLDFVGHIGGDDFIVLFRSEDWQQRCQLALSKFAEGIADYFNPDDRERGGYLAENRRGEMEFHALTALSIGAVEVGPGMFTSRLEVTRVVTEAKKKAKAIAGNSLFVNQRQYHAGNELAA